MNVWLFLMSDVIFHATEKIIYLEYQKCRWQDSRTLQQIALIRPTLAWFCKWDDGKIWIDQTHKLLIRWGHYSLVMLWLWKTEISHSGTVAFFTQLSQKATHIQTLYIYDKFISGVIKRTASPWWFFSIKTVQRVKLLNETLLLTNSKCWTKKDGYRSLTGLILGLRPANENRRYFVTTSLIGWAPA